MTATATLDPMLDEDEFVLDVRVIEDERPADVRACATDNGCPPTCASSCTSSA
jgi:FxLD family lantipeptide